MTAEELLMSDEVEVFQYSNVIEIDGQSRHVNVPLGEDMFGVEGDKNVTLKHFTCPKIVGNNIEIDLSEHNLYANYTLADEKGNPKSEDVIQSPCENIVIGDDNITFDWKISEWVTREDGFIAFSIVAKKSVDGLLETRWYTTPAVGKIRKTVKEGRYLEQQYPDVIDNLMNRVSDLERILANGGGTGGSIVVDDALSETSTNPVQNKVVAKEIRQLSEEIANLTISGLTTAQINALDGMFKKCAFTSNATAEYEAFKTAFGITGESGEEEEPDTPDNPEVTLSSISATYTGGDVAVGTDLTDLTGITVTAHYSDGSTANITGYTLSGTIVEGTNTITVSYGGKTTTFEVVGVVESGGEDVEPLYTLETASNVSLPDRYGSNPIKYSVSNGNHVEISRTETVSDALYMDVNLSSAITNGVELSSAPEWFKIPAGAEVVFKLTNVNYIETANTVPNMHFGIRETGASKESMAYVLEVLANKNITTGLKLNVNKTWETTATMESEISISGICADFTFIVADNIQFDVELYVNGERWI